MQGYLALIITEFTLLVTLFLECLAHVLVSELVITRNWASDSKDGQKSTDEGKGSEETSGEMHSKKGGRGTNGVNGGSRPA